MVANLTRSSSILVVEDEPLVALDLQELLAELGFRDVEVATRLDAAAAAVARRSFDLAFVDLDVAGETSEVLAGDLCGNGTRLIFISGYALSEAFLDRLRACHAPKPFSMRSIEAALRQSDLLIGP